MKRLILFSIVLMCVHAFARDFDRPLKPGNPHWRGNERSERPGRFSNGQPSYGGNGCPAGTMQVVFAPDFMSFTVLFDKFIAQDTGGPGKGIGPATVVSCDMQVPMQIPAGQQMEITRVDLRGFAGLPGDARATLRSSFNFRGAGGDRDRINLNYQFQGPYTDNYLVSTDAMNENAPAATSEVSPCGGQATLAISTQLRVQSRTAGASITLDSVDSSSHAIYFVNWRSCTAPPAPGRGRDDHEDHGRGH